MKNLTYLLSFIITGILFSCNDDSQISENDNFVDAIQLYEKHKETIQEMDRMHFAGLSKDLQLLAYSNFTNEKKTSWWEDKIEEAKKIKSLSNDQIIVLNRIQEELPKINFSENSYSNINIITDIKNNLNLSNFDNILVLKIFETLAPIANNGN